MICKLLERLIKDHIVDFLVKHKLLNSSQHGFLKARSCLTNMLCFLEEITKWIDMGSPVDIIYLGDGKSSQRSYLPHLSLPCSTPGVACSCRSVQKRLFCLVAKLCLRVFRTKRQLSNRLTNCRFQPTRVLAAVRI